MRSTAELTAQSVTRRRLLGLGGALVLGSGPLAACSGGDATARLRFAWWGNSARQEIYSKYARAFGRAHPNVTVQVEPAEYSGYVDRLAVQAGGRNLPDVFWIPSNQATTFASSDVLQDVSDLSRDVLNLAQIPQDQVASWKIGGRQVAPVYSQYSVCIQVDRTAFKRVGINDLPDDEEWTWSDLMQLATDYAKASGEGNWGIANQASFYQHAHMWIRQHGAEVFDADGNIGFEPDLLAEWFAWWQRGVEAGAVMPTEISGSETQWTQTSHRTGLYLVQLNQYRDNADFSDDHDLVLLKYPEVYSAPRDYQFHYYTRICISDLTEHTADAGKFIDYMLNDLRGAEAVGLASGIPVNPEVVDRIRKVGDSVDRRTLDMQDRIDRQPMRGRPEPPPGAADWQTNIETAADNIFNAGQPIDEAVRTAIADLQQQIDRG